MKIYLLIKYIKSILWRVAKRLSYTEEAQCLKVNFASCLAARLILLAACDLCEEQEQPFHVAEVGRYLGCQLKYRNKFQIKRTIERSKLVTGHCCFRWG